MVEIFSFLLTAAFIFIIVGFIISVWATASHSTEYVVRENLRGRYEDEHEDFYYYSEEDEDEEWEPNDPENPIFYDDEDNFLAEKYAEAVAEHGKYR